MCCGAAAMPPTPQLRCTLPWRSPCRRPPASAPRASASCTMPRPGRRGLRVFARSRRPAACAACSITVPGGVRAVTLMHCGMARCAWEAVVAPAERLARFGVPVSRALSRDLQSGAARSARPRSPPDLRPGTGTAVTEGDTLDPDRPRRRPWAPSANVVAANSSRQLARLFSDQIAQLGGSLPLEALRNAVPQAGPPAGDEYRGLRVYVAPPPMARRRWRWRVGTASRVRPPAAPTPAASPASWRSTEGRGGGLQRVDGPVVRRAHHCAGYRHPAGHAVSRSTAISPMVIGNPGNGEFVFAGCRRRLAGAAYATGVIARATVETASLWGGARRPAQARAAGSMPSSVPAESGRGRDLQAATDQAGGGLALLANPR